MKTSTFYLSLWVGLCSMIYPSTLPATPIFADEAVNVWVVDTSNQTVTTYSTGQWIQQYSELTGFNANDPVQILVNGLPQSSVPMSPLQPSISIIGLGEADVVSASYSGPGALFLYPASATSADTIEVLVQVSESVAEQGGGELLWSVNAGQVTTIPINPTDTADDSGYITKRFYFVANGTYDVVVNLFQNGQFTGEKRATYVVNNTDPLGDKRDSDGDGIPDTIEAQIGLDPLSADAFNDTDGDGWSEFDVWLRCEELDIANCSIPVDTDGDGWSDFDEELRGTNPEDYELPLPADGEEDEDYLQAKLLLQETPAARRLYEIEYIFSGPIGDSKFENIGAVELDGTELFAMAQLVSTEQLTALGVDALSITPTLIRANAEQNMASGEWPQIRVAGSRTLTLRATKPAAVPDGEIPSQQVSLLVLKGLGDLDIKNFPATQSGDWSSPERWRAAMKVWLASELVVNNKMPFSSETTRNGLLFEASLREEARLLQENEQIQLGAPALPREWVKQLQVSMQQREDSRLYDWYLRIGQASSEVNTYQELAASIDSFIAAMPASGTNTSEWLYARLLMPVETDEQGCFINSSELADIQQDPDYFAQWQLECPLYYTETDYTQWLQKANNNRYLLRMLMYTEGAGRIADSDTLAMPTPDTDSDTIGNALEVLQKQYDLATYPWLADSDGDNVADSLDQCPNDDMNFCSGDPNQPQLALGTDIQMEIGSDSAIALLEIVLSSPAPEIITFTYHIEAANEDNAVDGVDFIASTGTLTFTPGQQSMLIPAYLLANDATGTTNFRITITDLVGASLVADDNSQIVSVIRTDSASPEVRLTSTQFTINERQSLVFDASSSESGIDDPDLRFVWQQVSGPDVTITNPNSDMPAIVAPETVDVTELVFLVTVQNAEGAQSSASVSVMVTPVDDPPVVTGNATYTVVRNATLSIPKDELLSFVSEPDGEALSISQVTDSTGRAGTLTETALAFEFTPETTTGSQTVKLDDNPLDITSWIDNGIAYRTSQYIDNVSRNRIHTWTPDNGAEVLAEGEESYSGLVTDQSNQILYFSRYDMNSGSTWIEWILPNGTQGKVDTGNYASLFGAQVNANDGTLYHCMDSTWQLIDPQSASLQPVNFSCNRYAAGQATIDNQFCLTGEDGLYCSDDGVNFEPHFLLPSNTSIDRVFISEAATLVLYNDYTNQFLVAVDGQINGQLLHTFDNYYNQIQGVWINSVFYTLLPVIQNTNQEGVQLYKWQNGDSALTSVGEAILFTDQISYRDLSALLPIGDDLLWYGQKDLSSYGKYVINTASGDFTQVGDDYSGRRQLKAWKDSALFSTEINEGSCQWFELDEGGAIMDPSSPEIAEASCYGQLVYGTSLAYTLYDPDQGLQSLYVKYGASGSATAQFVVRISDENDNTVDLTVIINIVEGVE